MRVRIRKASDAKITKFGFVVLRKKNRNGENGVNIVNAQRNVGVVQKHVNGNVGKQERTIQSVLVTLIKTTLKM